MDFGSFGGPLGLILDPEGDILGIFGARKSMVKKHGKKVMRGIRVRPERARPGPRGPEKWGPPALRTNLRYVLRLDIRLEALHYRALRARWRIYIYTLNRYSRTGCGGFTLWEPHWAV